MREIVLDTETTGLDPRSGDRVVEIGCVEVVNYVATGQHYHVYINPERSMPAEAAAVHGLTEDFLKDKPTFAEIAGGFLEFVGEDPLVIHNAAFDMGFLNAELARLGFPDMPMSRAKDTVMLARRKFPGQRASLDALCERFGIDKSARTFHGALLDAQLLADVYLELMGGRQPGLSMDVAGEDVLETVVTSRLFRKPRPHAPSEAELVAHAALLEKIKQPMWKEEQATDRGDKI